MKKVIRIFIYVLLIGVLTGCSMFAPEEKEFSGSGISVTLTDDFVEGENVNIQMYVSSNKHVFMGNGETKSLFADQGYFNLTLNGYAKLVLEVGKKTATVETYSDDDTNFEYAYYTNSVEGQDYSYMLVCMEGKNKFYTMNFGCYTKNFNDETKEMYLEWAKTIRVE